MWKYFFQRKNPPPPHPDKKKKCKNKCLFSNLKKQVANEKRNPSNLEIMGFSNLNKRLNDQLLLK